mmetsp:Transcript_11654/g.26867  ORF Transcript_11654/g.26867 Transcript_11654/m.26867 type:complete len:128 (+) Transcript_11654:1416-1799(+)
MPSLKSAHSASFTLCTSFRVRMCKPAGLPSLSKGRQCLADMSGGPTAIGVVVVLGKAVVVAVVVGEAVVAAAVVVGVGAVVAAVDDPVVEDPTPAVDVVEEDCRVEVSVDAPDVVTVPVTVAGGVGG